MTTIPIPAFELPMSVGGFIGIISIAVFLTWMYFFFYWSDMRKNQPELHVMKKSRDDHLPIIVTVDKAGRLIWAIGDKDKDYSVSFKKNDYGLLVDPALLARAPKSTLIDGIPIYFYGTDTYFANDLQGIQAITDMIRKIRQEYAILEFVRDDFVLMELVTKSGEELIHDCGEVIARFLPDDALLEAQGVDAEKKITKYDLAETIEVIKASLKSMKVETGFFSVSEGIDRLPFGITAGDFERTKTLTTIAVENDMQNKHEEWMFVMKMFMAGAFVCILGFIIIDAVKGG